MKPDVRSLVPHPSITGFACALLTLTAFFSSCHHDGPAPAPVATRIVIEMDMARATSALPDPTTPAWALEGTWAVSDARDAWTAPVGTELSAPITLAGTLEASSAFVLRLPPGADRDDQVVECQMHVVSSQRNELVASRKCTLHEAAHGWSELRAKVAVHADEYARLVLTVRPSGLPLPAGATACFAVPRVVSTAKPAPKQVPRSTLQPNVLVISVDALRADHLGVHGYGRATSPHVDALLKRGVRFENAISTAPWTLPSYGTLFTGDLPLRNQAGVSPSREQSFLDGRKLEAGDFQFLSPAVTTLAERFATAGFATAGFVSNPYLDGATGIDRGFARWVMYVNRAQAGVALAERWIDLQGAAPWFLFLHLMDPHAPYAPPAPFDERFAGVSVRTLANFPPTLAAVRAMHADEATKKLLTDLYDGEIASTDESIGALMSFLEARGVLEHTLVVFHSDHGEEFWDHGTYEHGHTLHDELLRVPLAFVLPRRIPADRTVQERTSTVDVFATILELAGLAPEADIDGHSLVATLAGAPGPTRDCISEALLYGEREQKSISSGGLKLITDGGPNSRLFDLAVDPRELHDIAAERADRVAALREVLLRRSRQLPANAAGGRKVEFSRERRDSLEKLGYPGGDDVPRDERPR